MAEYVETKQDRDDAAKLADIDEQVRIAEDIRNILLNGVNGTPGYTMSRTLEGLNQDMADLVNRRNRIVKDGEVRIGEFYTDRAKCKRASKALRKAGFAVSFSEPSYESTREGSFAIVEAQQNGKGYAYASRDNWTYAFVVETGWRRTGDEVTDTSQRNLYIHWGPTEGDEAVCATFGRTIAEAFTAEGLKVEWDGTTSATVTINPTNAKS